MTWQGAGGAGGGPGDPDDATRTDWSVDAQPPTDPQPGPAEPPAMPPSDPAVLPPAAPVAPPPEPTFAPPAAPLPPGIAPSPWAPVQPGAGWGTPPPESGGRYAVPGAPGLVYAGALPRAAAWIVDSILLGVIAAILTIPFAASAPILSADATMPFDTSNLVARTGIASLIGLVVEAVYFIGLWLSGGRATLGMRLFSLQVGNIENGTKLEPVDAVKRWLGYGSFLGVLAFSAALAPLIGLVQLIWTIALLATTITSPTKQGLHDRFAGSAIVRPAGAGNGLAVACLVLALIIPVVLVFSLIALVLLGGQVSSILSAVGDSV